MSWRSRPDGSPVGDPNKRTGDRQPRWDHRATGAATEGTRRVSAEHWRQGRGPRPRHNREQESQRRLEFKSPDGASLARSREAATVRRPGRAFGSRRLRRQRSDHGPRSEPPGTTTRRVRFRGADEVALREPIRAVPPPWSPSRPPLSEISMSPTALGSPAVAARKDPGQQPSGGLDRDPGPGRERIAACRRDPLPNLVVDQATGSLPGVDVDLGLRSRTKLQTSGRDAGQRVGVGRVRRGDKTPRPHFQLRPIDRAAPLQLVAESGWVGRSQ